MINTPINQLIDQLTCDPWRAEREFSADITAVHQRIFGHKLSDDETSTILNDWIAKYQPCLFGRIAAKLGLIEYCILSDEDLAKADAFIQEKIQSARLQCLQSAANGDSSAFVIVAVSQKIALSVPDNSIFRLASRLCALYLLKEIERDRIYLDSLELEVPGKKGIRLRWDVGVNYFSSQADQRWWHDHRIPGGLADSMNSVGHLVMSGRIAHTMKEFEKAINLSDEGWRQPSIQNLETALVYAMRSIAGAARTVSGPATELMPIDTVQTSQLPVCPVELPRDLAGKNHCEYLGYYHTDFTLPSVYFRQEIERPPDINSRVLDFTYLFNNELDNPDHINVGLGRRVQSDDLEVFSEFQINDEQIQKRRRAKGRPIVEDTIDQ
jgi:hypothetical protein